MRNIGLNLQLYSIKGERYRKRLVTIKRWMEKDSNRDEKLKTVLEPKGLKCLNCGGVKLPIINF